jgi:hypothetical protein
VRYKKGAPKPQVRVKQLGGFHFRGEGLNTVAYFPPPALCQGAGEDVVLEIGAIVFPDFVQRNQKANGLLLKMEGDF